MAEDGGDAQVEDGLSLKTRLLASLIAAVYEWARTPVPVRQSPSPHSATYPDRPIRPLPKRPLRSRLSPEQAGSIVYPPAPPATGPLFSFPYSQSPPFSAGPHRGEGEHPYQHAHPADVHKPAEEEDVDDGYWVDGKRYNAKTGRIDRASMEEMNGSARPRGQSAAHPPPPPGSTTSSADGYESFENTNNKKKRKIPVSGAAGAHSNAVLAEAPGVAVPSSRTDASQFDDPSSGTGQYYGSGTSATSASGTGISGAGRGRYGRNGRVPSERRPLGLSTSGANARANPNAVTRKEWSGGASVDEKGMAVIPFM
ncbi:hypothetical protein P152DRAFT_446088 [Eremomyces bilateralis CBS 781.70]|uniref:Uncharacterized protein n=1 Tax=Eremomyces bilateralis CBS 781.70 TaxID=1392243 RepID=A0A6G1GEI0_9PEZI|nr:uncharacterized protein P152DRAFT_446088 [Eremomyces bilateralis CBS 781.70]KAF1816432.1 hypothetical protein P152DRAFT_446088 [Eremomyces bilateralis CBS 781.70]